MDEMEIQFSSPAEIAQGLHVDEARCRLKEMRIAKKNNLISELEKDSNAYSLNYIKNFGITPDELRGKIKDSKGQLRDEVLLSWGEDFVDISRQVNLKEFQNEIPKGRTEIFLGASGELGKHV